MPKKSTKRISSSRKKKPNASAKSLARISFLPESGIDFSNSRLKEIFYDANNLDLRISHAVHPTTTSDIKVRFEAIQDSDRVTFELGDILATAFGREQFKPNATFYQFTSKRSRASFPWRIEIAVAPLRKPYSFQCKRIRVLSSQGKQLAGDSSPVRPNWKIKDYKLFAERVGDLILAGAYEELLSFMHVDLRRKKKVDQVSREFERWKRPPKQDGTSTNKSSKQKYIVDIGYTDLEGGLLPEWIERLDPDTVRADLTIEFCLLFLLEMVIVSDEDRLVIGKYKAHRDW